METFKYEWGNKKTGLYIDINGSGKAYNLLLLVQHFSKRAKRGLIKVSRRNFKGAFAMSFTESTQDLKHWHIGNWRELGMETGHVSMPFSKYSGGTLYIKVIPNGKGEYFVK